MCVYDSIFFDLYSYLSDMHLLTAVVYTVDSTET